MMAHLDVYKPLPPQPDPVEVKTPLVLDESLVLPFKYWNGGVQTGMRHAHELYAHWRSYSNNERLKAYESAHQYAEYGIPVCITVSKTRYSVWLSLRSLMPIQEPNLQFMG